MKYIFFIIISFLFFGCSLQKSKDIQSPIVLEDLIKIPQNVEFYTKNIETKKLYSVQKEYQKSYYSMWNIQKPPQTKEDIKWPFKHFNVNKSYGSNLLPLKKEFFDDMFIESNFDEYLNISKKGLTLQYSNIRALPTSQPLLRDPSLAGEGFPFDYLQNSAINANVPLFISHYSKNKQWVFVFSSITYGWLRSSEIVYISDNDSISWQNHKQLVIIEEDIPLFTDSGKSLFNTRIGMLFALLEENENTYTFLCVSSSKNNMPFFNKSVISKDIASIKTLIMNKNNLDTVIKQVSKTNYGWGGLYEQRDCSSTIMDLFTPFGIYLPRNSSKQSKIGEVINLSKLTDIEKIKLIKEKAIPFQTLLYKKGHIVLYVGTYNNEIVVFQNVWGVKTKLDEKEGRFIVGKTVFSTLHLGKDLSNYDESTELLKNLESMNTITR